MVTPTLDRARRELLEREFNVTHLPMTVEEFANELLPAADAEALEGIELLRTATTVGSAYTDVPLVEQFAAAARPGSADYLLGRSPEWGDVRDGISAERECDEELLALAMRSLVNGTAGSGKTTLAMRLGLTLTARETRVGWADASIEISPVNLRRSMENEDAPDVLIIDDAERYGAELTSNAARIPTA